MRRNQEMVDRLKKKGYIESERIEKAFRNVDRADFAPKNPYVDRPVRLEEGSTVSAPHIVALMAELLDPEGKVLEMGSGSGYMLAILSELAEEVVGVERIEGLVESSLERVPEARIILGHKLPEESFDRILYSYAVPEKQIGKALNYTDYVVAPVKKGDKQVLKRFRNGEEEKISNVRFVEERKGIRTD